MSLNVIHPIGIHVTNTRSFPCMCGLRLCFSSDLLLAGVEEVVCHSCILYRISIDYSVL